MGGAKPTSHEWLALSHIGRLAARPNGQWLCLPIWDEGALYITLDDEHLAMAERLLVHERQTAPTVAHSVTGHYESVVVRGSPAPYTGDPA
jgi:hypothetical protein